MCPLFLWLFLKGKGGQHMENMNWREGKASVSHSPVCLWVWHVWDRPTRDWGMHEGWGKNPEENVTWEKSQEDNFGPGNSALVVRRQDMLMNTVCCSSCRFVSWLQCMPNSNGIGSSLIKWNNIFTKAYKHWLPAAPIHGFQLEIKDIITFPCGTHCSIEILRIPGDGGVWQ